MMVNITIKKQDDAQSSPDQTNSIMEDLLDALNQCPPRGPYKASHPIPTELLSWSPRKDLSSSRQNSFFTSSPHNSSSDEQISTSNLTKMFCEPSEKETPLTQEQDEVLISPDQTGGLSKDLLDALNQCPPRGPYRASDPIPTELLLWSPRKDLSSSRQNSFFTSSPHNSLNNEQMSKSNINSFGS